MKTLTYNFVNGQETRFEALRKTRMNGEVADDPKSPEEQMYAIVQAGLTALEQQRKQYAKGKAIRQDFAEKKAALKDPKILASPEAILRLFGRHDAADQFVIRTVEK